jgi:hypothetical protein
MHPHTHTYFGIKKKQHQICPYNECIWKQVPTRIFGPKREEVRGYKK